MKNVGEQNETVEAACSEKVDKLLSLLNEDEIAGVERSLEKADESSIAHSLLSDELTFKAKLVALLAIIVMAEEHARA